MNVQRVGWIAFGLMLWSTAQGIDPELYQKYKNYKSYQQSQQVETLSQARSAALSGDFEQAEQHLAAARNMAYAPDEIRAVEKLIEDERERRARLAQEEHERKERLAQEARQRQAATSSPQSTDCIASTAAIWDSNDIIDGTPCSKRVAIVQMGRAMPALPPLRNGYAMVLTRLHSLGPHQPTCIKPFAWPVAVNGEWS